MVLLRYNNGHTLSSLQLGHLRTLTLVIEVKHDMVYNHDMLQTTYIHIIVLLRSIAARVDSTCCLYNDDQMCVAVILRTGGTYARSLSSSR